MNRSYVVKMRPSPVSWETKKARVPGSASGTWRATSSSARLIVSSSPDRVRMTVVMLIMAPQAVTFIQSCDCSKACAAR